MTTQLCSRRRVSVLRAGISAIVPLLVLIVGERAMATPVSAQACGNQLPMPNAFRRYILDDRGAAVLADRRGIKVYFVRGKTLSRAAYFGNATGVRAVDAGPAKPYEVGLLGETGALNGTESALVPGVHVDNDNAFTPYIEEDARLGSPSFRCEYATAIDSHRWYLSPRVAFHSIQPAGPAVSTWMIGAAPQMVAHERDHGTVNFTYYQTNQALGEIGVTRLIPQTGLQTGGGPGFSYAITPYTRFYTTVYLQSQRPALSILMQFKPPPWSRLK